MKYIVFFLLLLFSVVQPARSQQTPTKNYIISRSYKQAGANANDVSKVVTQVQYLDGLGRPNQNVTVGQSPAGTDMVEPVEYDAAGRQVKQYLPFVATGNGSFKTNAIAEQAIWYSNNTAGLQTDPATPLDLNRAYNETIYQPSPLNRPSNTQGPGTRSPITYLSYGSNSASEINLFTYVPNSDIYQTISAGSYTAGTLYVTQRNDEDNLITLEFTDRQGRMVCKRVFASATDIVSTYYVYDKINQLRAVIQPQYSQAGQVPISEKLTNYAFLYDYDGKGRLIRKSVPSAGLTEYVYDNYDRAVLSRNAGQVARNVWAFTKFDVLNRPVLTGELGSAKPRSDWQTKYDAVTAHHENKTGVGETGYSLNLTSVAAETGFPQIADANVLTVTYYDDYNFPKPTGFEFAGSTGYPSSANTAVKSYVTGGKARILAGGSANAGEWKTNVIYYDAEYRTIQTVRDLYDMGTNPTERVSTQYRYDLAPTIAQQKTEQVVGSVAHSHEVVYTYDHADRLMLTKETINAGGKTKTAYTLAQQYNTFGQVKNRWFHAYSADQFKYRYRTDYLNNIRGWLTNVNTAYRAKLGEAERPFHKISLAYDNVNLPQSYSNGNISSMLIGGRDENEPAKGLLFTYDQANRLSEAKSVGGYLGTETGISYDLNGNILKLNRKGSAVDDLTYSYTGSGNRLKQITDASASNTGVKSGTSTFVYDANGNITTDGNRGAVITYNYLDLPKTIVVGGKTLTYDYDASGVKHKYAGDGITTKYAGIFEYDANNVFKRAATSTGQLVLNSDTLRFDYYLKDHLGNVRIVFTEIGEVIQQTDYYPFGLEIDRSIPIQGPAVRNPINRYNFLGKETQVATGYIDLQARFYDPLTGRFMQVDPETEGQLEFSPYHYSFNNPIRFSDPDGRFACCGGNPANLVLGQAQNAWNGVVQKVSDFAREATSGDPIASVNVSFGAQAGLKVGSYGLEVNAYSKELGSVNTNGEYKPGSSAETKGASINVGVLSGEVGKKLEQTAGSMDVKVGSMTLKSPTTTTTLEQSGSLSAFGFKLAEHSVTSSVTNGAGGQQIAPVRTKTNTSNLASYSKGEMKPSRSGNIGGSAVSAAVLIKFDIQVNMNKIKSLIGL
jgi:RHS repeat-associated protein